MESKAQSKGPNRDLHTRPLALALCSSHTLRHPTHRYRVRLNLAILAYVLKIFELLACSEIQFEDACVRRNDCCFKMRFEVPGERVGTVRQESWKAHKPHWHSSRCLSACLYPVAVAASLAISSSVHLACGL